MDIKKLIESLNKLTEETEALGEETLIDTPVEEPEKAPQIESPKESNVEFNDGMSLADTLDAKAKIARALENLKGCIEDFKDATAEKVDLIKDNVLIQQIEGLDVAVQGIEATLAEGILMKSELNDPFKAELPQEVEPIEDVESEDNDESEEGEEPVEDEEDEITDFDDEAGLDILGED